MQAGSLVTRQLSSAAVIREASPDDAAGAAALLSLVYPEFIATTEAVAYTLATSPPEAQRRWWCAEEEGALIGWASVGLLVETSEPGAGWLAVAVHPEHRGRGLGSTFVAEAEEHARSIGVRRVHARSNVDDATLAFLRTCGYEETSTDDILFVDPRTVTPPEADAQIELLPFTAFAADPSPIHHVDVASMVDEPGEIVMDAWELEGWVERFWRHPLLDHDASMVAVVEGTPAAVTFLQTDRARGRGLNNGTGTLREYRGRGLATLAKRASLARAAALGITAVYTGNDVTNEPMQAINRKLGYSPWSSSINWARTLVTT
jgi:GNAT superfamily N-acetyltransferase